MSLLSEIHLVFRCCLLCLHVDRILTVVMVVEPIVDSTVCKCSSISSRGQMRDTMQSVLHSNAL